MSRRYRLAFAVAAVDLWPAVSTAADSTNSDAVAKALPDLSWSTPVGGRSFSVKSHETFAPEYYGQMVKEPAFPFAVIKNPELRPASFPTN